MRNHWKKAKKSEYFYFALKNVVLTKIIFRNADETSHKRPLDADDAAEQAKKLRVESLLDDIK